MTRIQTLWGRSFAPARSKGRWPEKGGTVWASFPQSIMAAPRRKMEAPTVMMTSTMGWGFFTVRMAMRSKRNPAQATPATVRTKAAGRGRCSPPHRVTRPRAPSMTNSPWAKLISSVALKSMENPMAITA